MYESFFGLTRRPFSATPDPDCCAGVEVMQMAFDELCAFVDHGEGIAVVAAPAGTGKTLLCQRLVGECQRDYRTAFLANGNFETRRSLLQAVLYELGRPYAGMDEQELRLELTSAVNAAIRRTKGVFLIVDEAHLAEACVLDEIRSMTNLARQGMPLVRVLLSAQIQFEEMLVNPEFAAVNQRIRAHVMLEPISREESLEYIEFRLAWAGARSNDIFAPDAAALIAQVSDGIPRNVNQLCDHSLLLAFAAGERPVSMPTVAQALEDLKRLPLEWHVPESMSERFSTPSEPDDSSLFAAPAKSPEKPANRMAAADQHNQSIEIPYVFETGEMEITVSRDVEAHDGFGGSAVIEIGGSELLSSSAPTQAFQSVPSTAAVTKPGRPSGRVETNAQIEDVEIARQPSRETSSSPRERRPSQPAKEDFWSDFGSPEFVEEKVHVLATTRGAELRKDVKPAVAKDEVVLDRYAAIDAVTMPSKKAEPPKAPAPQPTAQKSKSPSSGSTSSRPDASPAAPKQCSRPSSVEERADVIVAVEEEIVNLVRETSSIVRGMADGRMNNEAAAPSPERRQRSGQQTNRSGQPQYDVIQPISSAESAAGDEREDSSPSKFSQLFSELRSRRSG